VSGGGGGIGRGSLGLLEPRSRAGGGSQPGGGKGMVPLGRRSGNSGTEGRMEGRGNRKGMACVWVVPGKEERGGGKEKVPLDVKVPDPLLAGLFLSWFTWQSCEWEDDEEKRTMADLGRETDNNNISCNHYCHTTTLLHDYHILTTVILTSDPSLFLSFPDGPW